MRETAISTPSLLGGASIRRAKVATQQTPIVVRDGAMKISRLVLAGAAGVAAYGLVRRVTRRDPASFFAGKCVVVTGGASGIGLAIVERLRIYGARVLVADIDADALAQLESEVPGIETVELDIASDNGPSLLLSFARQRLGTLDIVFSNAGVIWAAPFLKMTDADIRRLIEVNFTMQVRLTHELLPYFLERGAGVIAYTGSLSSYVYSSLHSVYTGTKGGLNGFVAAVRREIPAGSGVQLTIVHPNITRTGLVSEELFDQVNRSYWMQTPLQVADAFLQGVADNRRQVFVETTDHLFVNAERYLPAAVTLMFRSRMDDDLNATAEEAIDDSKLRKQIAKAASPGASHDS